MFIEKQSQKTYIGFLIFLVPFLMGMGVDLYVPSLPTIATYLHAENSSIQLTISFYMLGYGVGQVFLGFLSDIYGRRKILLVSAFVFTLLNVFIIFSSSVVLFILCRFLQGIGIAGLAVATRAIIVDCFSERTLAKMVNYFVLSWTLGPIIGPFIGGYLQHYLFWQANFYFFSLYGLLLYFFILFYVAETNNNTAHLHLPELYSSAKDIMLNREFIFITLATSLGYSIIVMFNVVGPFLIQTTLHYSVVTYGYTALVLGAAYSFGTLCNRIAFNYFDNTQLFGGGCILLIFFSILMFVVSLVFSLQLSAVLFPAILIFIFCGSIVPNGFAITMGIFPKKGGASSSIYGATAGTITFIVTMFGSSLKVNSQIPLASAYVIIACSIGLLFWTTKRTASIRD